MMDEFVQSLITNAPSVIALIYIITRQEKRIDALLALLAQELEAARDENNQKETD